MSWIQRLPAALSFLVRSGFRSLVGNLSLAALSVAVALSLWVYVIDRENPTQVQTFNGSITLKFVNIPTGLDVANTSDTTVRIRIQAPTNEINSLRPDDFDASVNMGGFPSGQVSVPVDVTSSNSRVQIVDVIPPKIDVTLEARREKDVPVQISPIGQPQQGFSTSNESVQPQTATVSGPESLVALVDHVAAEVILTGERVDIDSRVQMSPRDARGGEISRVVVSPDIATVRIGIVQRDFTKTFVVSPTITGVPAAGYNVTNVAVDPGIVTVTGTLAVLGSIDAVRGIPTEEVSLADSRSVVVRPVNLVLPAGARLEGGTASIRVTVSIGAAKGQQSYLVVPQVRNAATGLVVTQAGAVTVTLSGDVPTLQAITPESIAVTVDATGLAAGEHSLPMVITPPAGTTVVASDPPELTVTLVARQ